MNKTILSFAVVTSLMFTASEVTAHGDRSAEHKTKASSTSLSSILAARPDKVKIRYGARHPQQTLDFFGIKPGMTVVEALPGGGWYSKLLLPYLGTNGKLIGADYSLDMYPKFGFFDQKALDKKKTWIKDWTKKADGWRGDTGATVDAFHLGTMPETVKGSADAVVFIRALHNLARFEKDGSYLTKALSDAFQVLKPGGTVGIVQHMAPETASDKFADGSHGYLKQSFVIAKMKKAGFEFVASSEINHNAKDQPTEKDIVWRLPPSFATSGKDAKMKEQYKAIGESNRMTLTFRKPK